ncbi:MAG: hypothetical protein PF495_09780, partial [Spirochaetales bacterium]|jgi:maltooligosyltrehalose synthase|nr:hypothetical protein [Spirochaetales bacterium]
VPDTVQGTETWNLSFVDPDNRRPVDYDALLKNLVELQNQYQNDAATLADNLWQNAIDGKLKQWITWLTLNERIQAPELFLKGNYVPLKVSGKFREHIVAFSRKYENKYLIVVLPLKSASMPVQQQWEDTKIELPEMDTPTLENRLTRQTFENSNSLNVDDLFNIIPAAVLRNSD